MSICGVRLLVHEKMILPVSAIILSLVIIFLPIFISDKIQTTENLKIVQWIPIDPLPAFTSLKSCQVSFTS